MIMSTKLFQINSPETLVEYGERLLKYDTDAECSAYLSRDIDMTGVDWTPIQFSIVLDKVKRKPILEGNGHCIKNLYCRPKLLKCERDWTIEKILPYPGSYGLHIMTTGLLFAASRSFTIRNLTVTGRFDLNNIEQRYGTDSPLIIGGLTGAIDKDGRIENCTTNIDVCFEDNTRTRSILGIGGIAGANDGKILGCVSQGIIDRYAESKFDPMGISCMNGGFIQNSYSTKNYPVSGSLESKIKDFYKADTLSCDGGIADNIELYAPEGPLCSQRLKNFFLKLWQLLYNDVFIDKPLEEGYWYKTAVHKIARIVDENVLAGADLEKEICAEGGPTKFLALIMNNGINRVVKDKNKYDRYISRYYALLDALVLESHSFRKALLNIYESETKRYLISSEMWKYVQMARRTESYVNAVKADMAFAEAEYER